MPFIIKLQPDAADVHVEFGWTGAVNEIALREAVRVAIWSDPRINPEACRMSGVMDTDDNMSIRFWDQADRGYTLWIDKNDERDEIRDDVPHFSGV